MKIGTKVMVKWAGVMRAATVYGVFSSTLNDRARRFRKKPGRRCCPVEAYPHLWFRLQTVEQQSEPAAQDWPAALQVPPPPSTNVQL